MKASLEQIEEKYNEIGVNDHYSFLGGFYLKWNGKNELEKNELEDWLLDEKMIKKTMNYLDIVEVRRIPFGINFKLEDTLVMLSLIKSGERIELVRTHV